MFGAYPHPDFLMNGRLIRLSSVVNGSVESLSFFEHETFQFIKDWFTGVKTFAQHTSGSTGIPKSIEISREQMLASASLTQNALDLKTNETSLLCIDPKFIGGKMMLVRSFSIGMKLICIDPSANPLALLPVGQCVNFAAFVPYQIEKILGSNDPHLLDNVDKVIIGGAPLNASTVAKLNNHTASCYATYGMTETVSHIALQKLNGNNRQDRFHALRGISLRVDDRNCLVIAAPYLSEPVITNDVVDLQDARSFTVVGRWDNVINTGGVKILPEKVEAAIEKILSESGIYIKFFIHGIPDDALGQKIALIVEAGSLDFIDMDGLIKKLSQRLSRYELPKVVGSVETFVTTESGKINRLQTVKKIQTFTSFRNRG